MATHFFTFWLCNFSIIDFLVVKMHFINKHHCILEFKQHVSVFINLFFNLFPLIGHFGGILLAFQYISCCSQTKTQDVAEPNCTEMPLKCLQNTAKCSEMLQDTLKYPPKCCKTQ